MNNQDKLEMVNRYNDMFEKHGYSPESLGWGGGKERQHKRFQAILEIGILDNSKVLDIGCGFGDLLSFFKLKGLNVDYTGIDFNKSLLEIAKNNHKNAVFYDYNILEQNLNSKFDFVVSCGIFNFKLKNEDQYDYIFKLVSKMFDLCEIGVCIDFLSPVVDYKQENSFHPNLDNLLVVLKKITSKIIFRFDYLNYEFNVYLLK